MQREPPEIPLEPQALRTTACVYREPRLPGVEGLVTDRPHKPIPTTLPQFPDTKIASEDCTLAKTASVAIHLSNFASEERGCARRATTLWAPRQPSYRTMLPSPPFHWQTPCPWFADSFGHTPSFGTPEDRNESRRMDFERRDARRRSTLDSLDSDAVPAWPHAQCLL